MVRHRRIEAHAVLEVSDSVLDLGVAAMVSFQVQGVARTVGDEGVIAVLGKHGQLSAGRGFYPADDEPHRYRVALVGEGNIGREYRWCHLPRSLTQ